MKHIIFTALLLCTALTTAQNVNGVPLNSLNAEYIELTPSEKTFSKKLDLIVDYGQPIKKDSDAYLRDDDGESMVFNTMVHALNFMAGYGYELVEVYAVQVRDDLIERRYVLRKA